MIDEASLDISQLAVRMSKVKLLDLDYGKQIVDALNTAMADEEIFKVEMDGVMILAVYTALPLASRRELDNTDILTAEQENDTIKDIEKNLKHLKELEVRDRGIVESYISIFSFIILAAAFGITLLYGVVTSDVRMHYPKYVSNAIELLIEDMYQRRNDPMPSDAPYQDTDVIIE